jgi:conjugative transfer region protein (TIGR03748 family)
MKLALPLLSSAALLFGCAAAPNSASPVTATPAAAPAPAPTKAPAPASTQAPVPKTRPADEVQVGRYTTLAPVLSEADTEPLAVVAKVYFPRSTVSTVGDAVRHLLLRTGYRLAGEDRLDARARDLLDLRLPDNQRVLGPYRVDAMLGALVGRSFSLVADPASRVITYVAAGNAATPLAMRGAPSLARPSSTASAAPAVPASLQQRGPR